MRPVVRPRDAVRAASETPGRVWGGGVTPYYQDESVTVFAGDCLDVLRTLPDNSVDAVVTDPPYGLEFMGKDWDSFRTYHAGGNNMKPKGPTISAKTEGEWQPGANHGYRTKQPRCRRCGKLIGRGTGVCKCPDPIVDTRTAEGANQYQAWCELWAAECLRVLKPGGMMLSFGGTRTFHRLACAIEDAGFEVRDSIGYGTEVLAWCYGSGFPKSRNVSAEPVFCQRVPGVCVTAPEEAAESAARLLLNDLRGGGETPGEHAAAALHGLPVHLHPDYALPGRAEQDVLSSLRGGIIVGSEARQACTERPAGDGPLPDLRSAGEAIPEPYGATASGLLLLPLRGDGQDCNTAGQRVRRDGDEEGAPLRSGQSGMEGRGDLQAGQGELHRPEVRAVPAGVVGDGSLGRLRDGAPAGHGEVGRSSVDQDRVRESRQPQPEGQQAREPRPVADERGPQAGRGWPVCGGCGKPRIPLGLGTALKPSWEPIVVARKPLAGTVAQSVQQWGTGALNIDGCRVGTDTSRGDRYNGKSSMPNGDSGRSKGREKPREEPWAVKAGRWPPNVLLDPTAATELDRQSGNCPGAASNGSRGNAAVYGAMRDRPQEPGRGDSGGASRFFPVFRYEPKAPTHERPRVAQDGAGNGRVTGLGGKVRQCNVCETRAIESGAGEPSCGHGDYRWEQPTSDAMDTTAHPTVKPLDLMRWLVRLVTPPGGLVLDPFAGSGTTAEACVVEGFRCVTIERDSTYLPLIRARLTKPIALDLFGGVE